MVLARRKNWNDYVVSAETIARSEGFAGLRDSILARAAIQDGERVIDLGAGTGLLTLPAAAGAERVWAVDISRNMCDYLAARPDIRRVDRYTYTIDGRKVDFTAAITPAAQAYPIT